MAVVYRAYHLALQESFALKLISRPGNEAFFDRFRIEAEALGQLHLVVRLVLPAFPVYRTDEP
jgi:hypothetical protein